MKPVHLGLALAAAALGGALFMKVASQKTETPETQAAPAVAQQELIPAEPVAAEPVAEPPAPPVEAAPAAPPERPARPAMTRGRPRSAEPPRQQTAQVHPPPAPEPPAPVEAAPADPPAPVTPAPEPAPPPAPAVVREPEIPTPPPPPNKVTLPAGTMLQVRLVEGLSTDRNLSGDAFTATLDQPITADGFVIAERGARLEGRVVSVQESGRAKGLAEIGIALTRLHTSDGQTVPITTDTFTKVAPSTVKRDVGRGAAATGIGAAIGAIAGGGKGAGIGAAIGAAAGIGGALATKGDPARLPSETRLTFRLSEPVTITERRK